MKKIAVLLMALVSLSILTTSCDKDDDELGSPTLNFVGDAGYVDGDATIVEGTTFNVGVSAFSNTESGKKLTTLRITRTMDNITFLDTTYTINEDSYNAVYTFNAQTQGTGEVINFVLTDKADQTAQKSITITYEAPSSSVAKVTGIEMGSHNDSFGSFYSVANNLVYSVTDATANQAAIDFLYYKGATNLASIASPADGDAATVYPALDGWTNKNGTLFQTTDITSDDFDAIGSTYSFGDFTSELSAITQLDNNQVIMFKTWDNKLGLIKVVSINSRGDYAILDVIAQN